MSANNVQTMLTPEVEILSKNLFKYSNYDELFNSGEVDEESKETYGIRVLESLQLLLKGKSLEEIEVALSTLR